MTGIVGQFRFFVAEHAKDRMASMARMLHARGNASWQVSEDGQAWLGSLSRDDRANIAPPKVEHCPLVLDGRLDNRPDLEAKLAGHARHLDDVALLRALYLAHGRRMFSWLRGDYALALYDPVEKQLLLACDVVGARPLLVSAQADAACFSSDAKALLALPDASRAPNLSALAELLLGADTGAHARGETLFQGIEAIRRGHVQTWGPRGKQEWVAQRFAVEPHSFASPGALAEEYAHLFTQAVRRRISGGQPAAIAVSGGLDSSCIYCVALELAAGGGIAHPLGLNFTTEDGGLADERQFTDALIEKYGQPLRRVPVEPGGFLAVAPRATRDSESVMLDPAGVLNERMYRAAAAGGCGTYITGFWGDNAFFPDDYWYHLLWSLRIGKFMEVVHESHRWMEDCTEGPADSIRKVLTTSIRYLSPDWMLRSARSLRRVSNPRHPLAGGNLGKYLGMRETPRTFAPSRRQAQWQLDNFDSPTVRHYLGWQNRLLAPHGMTPAWPFLDADLVQFCLRCDGDDLNPGGRIKGLLRDAMKRRVPDLILQRRTKGDFTELTDRGFRRDCAGIVELLHADCAVVRYGMVDAAALGLLRAKLVSKLTQARELRHTVNDARRMVALEFWLSSMFGSPTGGG